MKRGVHKGQDGRTPQARFGPQDKSIWPWNEHNAMQVQSGLGVPSTLAIFTSVYLLRTLEMRGCLMALQRKMMMGVIKMGKYEKLISRVLLKPRRGTQS